VRLRLFSFGPDNDLARVRAADDHPLADLGPGTAWPMDAGLGRFRSAEALYMIDDLGDEPATALEERLFQAGCRSCVVAPVGEAESVQGMLLLAAEQPGAFTTTYRSLIEDIADLMGAALDRLEHKPPQPSSVPTDDSSVLKSAFLANVHHELRTPLTSIIGFAEVLSEDGEETTDRFADLIARSGRRLQKTFENLLSLFRLEAGTMPVDRSPLSVTAEVRTVVASFADEAPAASLTFDWNSPDASLDALLDHDGLHDVLRHLLDNAIKFTEVGGTVTVRLDATDDIIVLAVADTGIGMDPGRVPELFAPFRQASTGLDRSYEGCGLGLAIVQGWTDAMGGTVNVETAPGAGTTVTVRLPRESVDP